ncbi:WLM-domain-containing protein [Coniophora puteana RWD-64-598 SS2]|uniref:WLM-domain-containing protein n=1 Tax=Coniophora puteana (strain RWD-64-598) TaxID=741705 RepID=A0A5M3MXY5_CONPW|nr:WLM-domain-containing protein [Coniophora puteana RWD-64-598 SS2]EIW83877.1 WLM-domain-containing protein [Coniophora puteana RWD-64-598 SS2]
MVHVRINERETNPNQHINFISVLSVGNADSESEARTLMRALAAQVRPVMKQHGFTVNSFEEYEYNKVFAGRNWNAGENVEIVLRTAHGSFAPLSYLMSTLCHELAHIKHMNHSPAFHALWRQLNSEVRALQNRGYFGDGYWSSGQRLADSARVSGEGVSSGDFPEYVCGGAHTKSRSSTLRRRRRAPRGFAGPSVHTGAQTERKRKAGARVTSRAFEAGGQALNEGAEGEEKSAGTGFRKQAGSKRAREERALAAERRLQALHAGPSRKIDVSMTDEDAENDMELVPETDEDRKQFMLDTMGAGEDLGALKFSLDDYFRPSRGSVKTEPLSSRGGECDSAPAKKRQRTSNADPGRDDEVKPSRTQLDLADAISRNSSSARVKSEEEELVRIASTNPKTSSTQRERNPPWACNICTLENNPGHLACSVCGTPKGETTWAGSDHT